ncbi:MAG: sugar kinase [Candidatus Latescibacteria bacterium]|nr:sugar kinase [Candidatus Latescibacterota bacterium]NIM20908.1 sugar kinase [Candidatus Latescibacterota bacterium]NIM65043.1 sugar kinase [Candidatus Latescibacterota bacterium]NIO01558.1 sugar kinase [Candidatus Latescibacterota bacterium]NIO28075.1 sugar kinase [Candidatus Latescibacterota bacterium]
MTNQRLSKLLDDFKKLRVAIVGDFILDRYMIGDTERVSREAPVLVVTYRKTDHHPGGAANAAQNVTGLLAKAQAIGLVGEDPEGSILLGLLEERGVDISGILRSAEIETAVKIRVVAGELHAQRQQVVRIDRSYCIDSGSPLTRILQKRMGEAVQKSDVVLISDYGMGVVPGPVSDAAIEMGRTLGIPIVVDSRHHLLDYNGATAATPNESEVIEALNLKASGTAHLETMTEKLVAEAGLRGVIVTRGSSGMFVREPGGTRSTIGVIGSNEATDVTGAGDTVSAVTSLSLAAGATLTEAAEMATYAASVVVMKRGTATVSPEELRARLEQYPSSIASS